MHKTLQAERGEFEIMKILKLTPLARASTRTLQGFYHFYCHKRHRLPRKILINKRLNLILKKFQQNTNHKAQISSEPKRKTDFLLLRYSFYFALLSLLFHLKCDTCDSKKSTSLLEGARYARAREQ